jgi:predicted transcriptional regulator
MKPTKEERAKTEFQIVEFLFKRNAPARLTDIAREFDLSQNEAQYYCEELRRKGLIYEATLPPTMTKYEEGTVYGFDVSADGRKLVMESA